MTRTRGRTQCLGVLVRTECAFWALGHGERIRQESRLGGAGEHNLVLHTENKRSSEFTGSEGQGAVSL